MPTGYTSRIADGITFSEFAMSCARAMGALIMIGDEPANAPIPERFEPSDYHDKRLIAAQAEFDRLRRITPEQAEEKARIEFIEESARHAEAIQNKAGLRQKYESMLDQVKAWQPPTPDHEGMKKFMVEQIVSSIEFDCNDSYYRDNPPKQKSITDWLEQKVSNALHDIEYHRKGRDEEIARTESRNAWLKALRDSLKQPDPETEP